MDREWEKLEWKLWGGLVRIRTIADNSCFFHALANSYFDAYRSGFIDGKAVSKQQIVRNLRRDLASKLAQPVDPLNPQGATNYDLLSRGQLQFLSEEMPEYSLTNMQRELESTAPVSNLYNEFISNQLNRDIYLLNGETQDVYITGNDDDILYQGRESIVILYIPGHYELVGLLSTNDQILTHFPPSHPLIQSIRHRMSALRSR